MRYRITTSLTFTACILLIISHLGHWSLVISCENSNSWHWWIVALGIRVMLQFIVGGVAM
jgi:hypothetical protein